MRIAARIALFALIGAAATVLVAWGCAAWIPLPEPGPHISRWPGCPPWSAEMPCSGVRYESEGFAMSVVMDTPHSDSAHYGVLLEAGWPALALDSIRWESPRHSRRRGLAIPDALPLRTSDRWEREYRMFPVLPLWPGFAVDTAFYGGLAFVVWSAPWFVRRRVRRRRGWCVRCGYELAGVAVCPECGDISRPA